MMSLQQQALTHLQKGHCAGSCVPHATCPISRRPRHTWQQPSALPESASCIKTTSRAARGRVRASGANGTEDGAALLQLADRQASSSNAGPSHNSAYKSAAEPIRQHSIPEGNPNLATLVGPFPIPFQASQPHHNHQYSISIAPFLHIVLLASKTDTKPNNLLACCRW